MKNWEIKIKRKNKRNCKWNQKEYINGYNIMNWCEGDGKETKTLKCTSVNMYKGSVGSWAARNSEIEKEIKGTNIIRLWST